MASWLAGINVLLAIFNLVPGAPLDGGRVLRSYLWHRHGDRTRATVSAAHAGRYVAFTLIGLGLLEFLLGASIGGLWLVFIGWFILGASNTEPIVRVIAESTTEERARAIAEGVLGEIGRWLA